MPPGVDFRSTDLRLAHLQVNGTVDVPHAHLCDLRVQGHCPGSQFRDGVRLAHRQIDHDHGCLRNHAQEDQRRPDHFVHGPARHFGNWSPERGNEARYRVPATLSEGDDRVLVRRDQVAPWQPLQGVRLQAACCHRVDRAKHLRLVVAHCTEHQVRLASLRVP